MGKGTNLPSLKNERKMEIEGEMPASQWQVSSRDRQEKEDRDLPPVRNGPIVCRLYSQSVAAAYSKVHPWCQGDDPRAREKLGNLKFVSYLTCWSASANQTDLFKFDIKICRFFFFFGDSFVSVDFLSASWQTNNNLSLVSHLPNNIEIMSPH